MRFSRRKLSSNLASLTFPSLCLDRVASTPAMDLQWERIRAFDIREPSVDGAFPLWTTAILPRYERTLGTFSAEPSLHAAVEDHLNKEKEVFQPWHTSLSNSYVNTSRAAANRPYRLRVKGFVKMFQQFLDARYHAILSIGAAQGLAAAANFVVSQPLSSSLGREQSPLT